MVVNADSFWVIGIRRGHHTIDMDTSAWRSPIFGFEKEREREERGKRERARKGLLRTDWLAFSWK